LKFNDKGNIVGLNLPIKLTNDEKNIILSYFWKIQMSRKERAMAGKSLVEKINRLDRNITTELANRS
jgi:hypothetical protein